MIQYIIYKLIRKLKGFDYFKTYTEYKQMIEGIETGKEWYDEYGGIHNVVFK